MILDRLEHDRLYAGVHPGFSKAFGFLRRRDLASLADGKHVLDADRLYASVEHHAGRGRAEARPEFHRRYIDIQFTIAGVEVIGWRSLLDCANLAQAYDPDRDVGFYGDAPEFWMTVKPGSFAIFYPDDVHAPLAGDGPVHKVVMKILA